MTQITVSLLIGLKLKGKNLLPLGSKLYPLKVASLREVHVIHSLFCYSEKGGKHFN